MGVELFCGRLAGRRWTARRDSGSTVELRPEPLGDEPRSGCVIKARVSNVVPGIQSAFLDIGSERAAFLHAADLQPAAAGERRQPIEDRLREGSELLVQVVRESRGNKGSRVSCNLTLAGRTLVLSPRGTQRGVSRRIVSPEERQRLQHLIRELPGEGVGWVARTAAAGVSQRRLLDEADRLLRLWEAAMRRAEGAAAPVRVVREPDLLIEMLRDAPSEGVERIVLEDPQDRQMALDYLLEADPVMAARLALETPEKGLFCAYGLDVDIDKALRPRVWLKSGGYLVIEETEALVSIDVNTGKYTGKRDFAQTVLRTNREAVREIPRQLRLRGLGGIIVIDMIDMPDPTSREEILGIFAEELRKDPARTRIAGITELGLLQLTRKWARPGIARQLTRPCEACQGLGHVRR